MPNELENPHAESSKEARGNDRTWESQNAVGRSGAEKPSWEGRKKEGIETGGAEKWGRVKPQFGGQVTRTSTGMTAPFCRLDPEGHAPPPPIKV